MHRPARTGDLDFHRGYSTEREILDGPINDVHKWQYERICEGVGGGIGHKVGTHGELVQALDTAFADKARMHVVNVVLDPADRSPAMMRLAHRLAKRVAAGI